MSNRNSDIFDPENVSKEAFEKFAKTLDEYLTVLNDVIIIPKPVREMYGKNLKIMDEGREIAKKLVSKLLDYDTGIFKEIKDTDDD